MRLRLFARLRWPVRPGWARGVGSRFRAMWGGASRPPVPAAGRHRRDDHPAAATAAARATRGATTVAGAAAVVAPGQPSGVAPFASPVQEVRPRPARPGRGGAGRGDTRGGSRRAGSSRSGAARVAVRVAPKTAADARPAAAAARQPAAQQASADRLPWYEIAHARRVAGGRRNCGPLEQVLCRDWDESMLPPPEVVRAIDRLAELPATVSERLADGLDAIYVGPGGV